MARKKVEITQEEIERRIMSGQRIRNYRKENGLSQEELAEKLDIQDTITIRRYEMNADIKHNGKFSPMPEKIARRMETESGIIADYWMGRTAETTYNGRISELSYNAASDEAEEQLHRLRAEEAERRRSFFYMCGYRYESIEGTAAADFSPDPRPHILTSYADNTRHELTEEQFQDLFNKLQDTINFACYQADRANQ